MRLDEDYSNSKYIPGGEDFPPRWERAAEAFRAAHAGSARPGVAYGAGERNWFDLYLPPKAPEGLAVFLHGGYWMRFSPRDFSHLAAGALARGWACAVPAYTLAPAARIAAMTREIAAAVTAAAGLVDGPIVVTGHSAGGHLAARMACEGVLAAEVADRLVNVVPISPLSDLGPLRETSMNETLMIDAEEALDESPSFLLNIPDLPVHVWVGAAERPAFLDQARWLGESWGVPVTAETGRHHFDVIEGLERADTALMTALLG